MRFPEEPWAGSSEDSPGSTGSVSPVSANPSGLRMMMTKSKSSQTLGPSPVRVKSRTPSGGGKFVVREKTTALPQTPKKPLSKEDESWLFVTPRQRVKPRECDEVPDEFRRAGIGLCFEGNADESIN